MLQDSVRNVFILTVDSLSYEHFSEYAAEMSDELDGVNFRNAIAPASNTRCSAPAFHAGIFADSELIEDSPIQISAETENPPTVAEQFKSSGYETGFWTPNQMFGKQYNYHRGFIHGNKGATQNNKRIADFLRNHGTKRLFDIAQMVYFNAIKPLSGKIQDGEDAVWEPASSVQADVLNWFENMNNTTPVFCWVHYMDTHHPFEPPREYLDRQSFNREWNRSELSYFTRDAIKKNAKGLSKEEIEDVESAYKASCEYLSDQISDFVQELQERGHFDPNQDLLCFTADHGTAFSPGKHHLLGHASFFEEIIRVPLVITRPTWKRETIDKQVSLIDLMPTVLNAAGIEVPGTFEGASCKTPESMEREHVFMIDGNPIRRGIRGKQRKLFGHRSDGDLEIVFTKYDTEEQTEEIILRTKYRDSAIDSVIGENPDTQEFYDLLRSNHGSLIEDMSAEV